MKAKENKVIIYIDIEGNVALDTFFEETDIPMLKDFLTNLGIEEIEVEKDDLSIVRNQPFAPDIPIVKKKFAKRIQWLTIPVIEELLCSSEMDDYEKTKRLCTLSGFEITSLPDYEQPSGFISPRYSDINKEFERWKRENKKTETPTNKRELVREWAVIYIAEQKKIKLKRVAVGTKVMVTAQNINGTVKGYNEENGEYDIELDNGFSGAYKRKEFEVI
jgi:hypothetical protein